MNINGVNIDDVIGLYWTKTIIWCVVVVDLMMDLDHGL